MINTFRVYAIRCLFALAAMLCLGLMGAEPVPPEAGQAAPEVKPASVKGQQRILVLQLREQVDPVLEIVIRKAFAEARKDELVQAIIIDMNTPGGRIDNTKVIIDAIRSSRVPVYTFVNTEAISAGSIIALATKGIFMAPVSTIGCATPIMISSDGAVQEVSGDFNEKMLSYTRSLARSLAQSNGYMPDLAEAFVDRTVEVKIGDRVISEAGKLLTLTAVEAVEIIPPRTTPLLARAIVPDLEGIAKELGLPNATIVRIEPSESERLARFLTMLSPILLMIALAAGYMEIKTPGFGIPGTISLICFFLFLSANHVAGFSGALEPILIIIGVILLLLELFVIPGFGVAGILGLGCLVTGIIMAMVPSMPGVPELPGFPEWSKSDVQPFLQVALINFLIALVALIVVVNLLSRYMPKSAMFSHIVLQQTAKVSLGYVGLDSKGHQLLLGQMGVALTDLRPAGMALIANQRVDVVSFADFIAKGSQIQVQEVNGPRVAVIQVTPTDEPAKTANG